MEKQKKKDKISFVDNKLFEDVLNSRSDIPIEYRQALSVTDNTVSMEISTEDQKSDKVIQDKVCVVLVKLNVYCIAKLCFQKTQKRTNLLPSFDKFSESPSKK